MSHEQSETVQAPDGSWINVYGKALPQRGQQLPGTPSYPTVDEAVKAAKERSRQHGLADELRRRVGLPTEELESKP